MPFRHFDRMLIPHLSLAAVNGESSAALRRNLAVDRRPSHQ
jgi:hypothetical protein